MEEEGEGLKELNKLVSTERKMMRLMCGLVAQMLQKGWVDRRVVKETVFEMVWACIENR